MRLSSSVLAFATATVLLLSTLLSGTRPFSLLTQSNWAMALPVVTSKGAKSGTSGANLVSMAGSGALTATDPNGKDLGQCPLKHTAVKAQISGYAARVTVEQVFGNPYFEPIEAVYTFPLSDSCAVDEMKMEIGKRVICGSIQKKDEAQKTYIQAKKEGHAAALLEQQRANVFTQYVTNIPPRCTVKISIKYNDILSYKSGCYTFVVPLVVGPRYMPGNELHRFGAGTISDTAIVPDASKISPPMAAKWSRAGHDVSVDVEINAGMPIAEILSKLHKVEILKTGPNTAHISIARGDRIPNKDFVLSWSGRC